MKHKILRDFKIKIDHPILDRRPDFFTVIKEENNFSVTGIPCPRRPQNEIT